MKNEDKYKRFLYNFWQRFTLVGLFGSLVFFVLGVSVSLQKYFTPIPFFVLFGLCFLILIATQIAIRILEAKGWYKELDNEEYKKRKDKNDSKRTEKLSFVKYKNKKVGYKIELKNVNVIERIEQLLNEHTKIKLNDGYLFYRITKKRLFPPYISTFYMPDNNVLDYQIAEEYLKKFDETLVRLFSDIHVTIPHIYCVIIMLHDKIDSQTEDFYYAFTGFSERECDNQGRLITDRQYNFCGIDMESSQVYFFKTTSTDNGTEANLTGLIVNSLSLQKSL